MSNQPPYSRQPQYNPQQETPTYNPLYQNIPEQKEPRNCHQCQYCTEKKKRNSGGIVALGIIITIIGLIIAVIGGYCIGLG